MLFWYPGGAGSTEEAKPVLDLFCEELNSNISNLDMKCIYVNSNEGGLTLIKKNKPEIAIISHLAWIKHSSKLSNSRVILATNPIPQGVSTETFTLVGKDPKQAEVIYTTEPYGEDYIKKFMFPSLTKPFKNIATGQLLMTLKKISSGEINALAILSPLEAKTLESIQQEWKKNLNTISKSNPVPSARVVILKEGWRFEKQFFDLLLGMKDKSKELLEELHLKGFSKDRP